MTFQLSTAMIERELDNFVDDFYQNNTKALMLTGARQTGKTYAIRRIGKSYKCFVEINFVDRPEAIDLLKNADGLEDLLLRVSALTHKELVPGETLIFFDEVQKCPDIVTATKFLVDDGRYRYALSGSLLGVELKDLRSEPVGYIDVKEVYPLTLNEFFKAVGVGDGVIKALEEAWLQHKPVDDFIHVQIMRLFRIYLLVGGMPAAVKKYLQTNDLQAVRQEQRAILRLYKRDIAQYDPDNKLYLDEILDLIPSELNAKNKRFILKNLNEKAKFSRLVNDFLWLKNAGVAIPTYNVEEPKLPLLLAKSRNLFKLFQNDVGLLASQYSQNVMPQVLEGDASVNFGSIYENVVAQELLAQGYPLYYFNSKHQGEVDFLIEQDNAVLPIEVKSGKDYLRHNALNNLLSTPEYGIQRSVVLHNDNLKDTGSILYAPIYMVAFMRPQEPKTFLAPPDLSGLR